MSTTNDRLGAIDTALNRCMHHLEEQAARVSYFAENGLENPSSRRLFAAMLRYADDLMRSRYLLERAARVEQAARVPGPGGDMSIRGVSSGWRSGPQR